MVIFATCHPLGNMAVLATSPKGRRVRICHVTPRLTCYNNNMSPWQILTRLPFCDVQDFDTLLNMG
jgi:hypothetical protein